MNAHQPLRVVLLALTGFGNPVLEALLADSRVALTAVFTVRYDSPYPYYAERHIIDVCEAHQIPCHWDVRVNDPAGLDLLRKYAPDLVIISTFTQILKRDFLGVPQLGSVNFHPSLLPLYRGPSPTKAALDDGVEVTGVTAHFVTEGMDDGDILLQRELHIEDDDDDGRLRFKLAHMTGMMVPALIDLFADRRCPIGQPQNHARATQAPKPRIEDGYLELISDFNLIRRKIKSLNPFPGTSFQLDSRRIPICGFESFRPHVQIQDGVYEQTDSIDLILNGEGLKLKKK